MPDPSPQNVLTLRASFDAEGHLVVQSDYAGKLSIFDLGVLHGAILQIAILGIENMGRQFKSHSNPDAAGDFATGVVRGRLRPETHVGGVTCIREVEKT